LSVSKTHCFWQLGFTQPYPLAHSVSRLQLARQLLLAHVRLLGQVMADPAAQLPAPSQKLFCTWVAEAQALPQRTLVLG
jgi:hypothetical protein